jgi:hypothetical protein
MWPARRPGPVQELELTRHKDQADGIWIYVDSTNGLETQEE